MTTVPTPAEFLLASEPDEDEEQQAPPTQPSAALDLIANSLETIAAAAHVSTYLDQEAVRLREALANEVAAAADAEALNAVQADLIARVLEVVKPSTSKVANAVREVLAPADVVEAPHEETETDEHNNDHDAPPAKDAPVEEWRAYARSRGYAGSDVDKANRSQIRSLLGVAHPGA